MEKIDFLDSHKKHMELMGFWSEEYKSVITKSIESRYVDDVIREWCISDIVINGDKILLKWDKRHSPLSDEQIKSKYGR